VTIIRAPRPSRGFSIIDNNLIRNAQISRAARCLLMEMLSHTDGWRTDSISLAASGSEGRDAIRNMLKELETFRYVRRVRRRGPKGHWSWTTYVFDQPASDEELDALIGGPKADLDEVAPGWSGDGEEGPDWAQEPVNPQVSPWTPLPATDDPAPDQRSTGQRSTASQAITTEEEPMKKKQGGRAPAQPHHAREPEPPPENPPNHDEHGPLTPQCPKHVGSTDDPPCHACRDVKPEWEAAENRRANARARAKDLAARQARADREAGPPASPETIAAARAVAQAARQAVPASTTKNTQREAVA
jgi:hypothetical protein